jgi:Tfp pilus assembly protein PilN
MFNLEKFDKKDINLMGGKQIRARKGRQAAQYVKIVGLAIVSIVLAVIILFGVGFAYLAYENYVSKTEIARLSEIEQKTIKILNQNDFVGARISALADIDKKDKELVAYLEKFERAIPADVVVMGFSVTKAGEIEIVASAQNEAIAGDFLNTIKENKLATAARITNIDMGENTVKFTITGNKV